VVIEGRRAWGQIPLARKEMIAFTLAAVERVMSNGELRETSAKTTEWSGGRAEQAQLEPVGASHCGALTVSSLRFQGHTRGLFLPRSKYASEVHFTGAE
jgi:hypothetical protein